VTPELGIGAMLGGLGQEVGRNAVRGRNGIKYLTGGEWAPVEPTPSDVVWRQGKARLRRYRRDEPARLWPPVIAFIGLVSRGYILDLWKGNSFVQRLIDAGFETFVLDWGEPDESDAGNTLETYVGGYLPSAITAVRRETGSVDVNVIGYCMGGDLALLALAARPDLAVRNLVTMATPLDFRHMGPLVAALGDGRIQIDSIIDETGNVPASRVRDFFTVRKPTSEVAQFANLWQHLWDNEYMQGYQAMSRWVREQVPIPGQVAREVVSDWIRQNAFYNDTLRLGGHRVRLADVRTPTLAVIATRDHIVPQAAAAPIARLLSGTDVEVLLLDAGHASLTSGRTAATVTVPQIIQWLADRSQSRAMSIEPHAIRTGNQGSLVGS
jgi:polyhydroxyalkanoate synthase subunit PhaC